MTSSFREEIVSGEPSMEAHAPLKILCVGRVCLDIVQMCAQFPSEDSTQRGAIICAWAEEGAIARTPCGSIVQSPAFPPQKIVDTLGAGDTFNAAALYYLNRSKVEFMHKYKREVACMNDNQTKDDAFDNDIAIKLLDIKENVDMESLEYIRTKFINEKVLQQAIKFACCIAGAKVGLRGYDCLDVISSDILSKFFEH